MTLCRMVLEPIIKLIHIVLEVITMWIERVCEWVSSVISVIKKVINKICSWFPWPINLLCKWVTSFIEVLETVWNWVCKEIVHRIIQFIEAVVSYIVYVMRWICILIDLPRRAVVVLACMFGVRAPRVIEVCVVVLPSADGQPSAPPEDIQTDIGEANEILAACNVQLVLFDILLSNSQEWTSGTSCGADAFFQGSFTWFSNNTCGCCGVVTLYYVESITAKMGCAFPGSDWLLVGGGGGLTVAHELGHLCGLTHTADRSNLMYERVGGTQLSRWQCCLIASSQFATAVVSLPARVALESNRKTFERHRLELEGQPWHTPSQDEQAPAPGQITSLGVV